MNPVIYAADIGSIKSGNFGWARVDSEHGTARVERDNGSEIEDLVDAVHRDLTFAGRGVALGFECPLFVPVPMDPVLLGAARPGEGNRPWSGGPGTAALATGLVQTAWILRELRDRCADAIAYLDWNEFMAAGTGLFLWEAFVTGKAKAATHVDDAVIAATCFREALPDPPGANAVRAPNPFSLIGSAILWSGWSTNAALLHKPCLVIKASAPDVVSHTLPKAAAAEAPAVDAGKGSRREKLAQFAAQIPEGKWTTYGCAAKIIGGIAIGVGGLLRTGGIANDHRILNSKGRLPDGAPANYMQTLMEEGVRFVNGRADPQQKWCPE